MSSLAVRDRRPEVMDQPGLDERLHHQALEGLRRGNRREQHVARAVARPGSELECLQQSGAGARARRRLRRRRRRRWGSRSFARRRKRRRSRCTAATSARSRSNMRRAAAQRAGVSTARFFQLNALEDPLPTDYDAIYCTLFLHHLAEPTASICLRRMAAADARCRARRRPGALAAGVRAGLGRMLPADALAGRAHRRPAVGSAAALSLDEARELAERAGLHGATIRRHWPERFLLTWRKP